MATLSYRQSAGSIDSGSRPQQIWNLLVEHKYDQTQMARVEEKMIANYATGVSRDISDETSSKFGQGPDIPETWQSWHTNEAVKTSIVDHIINLKVREHFRIKFGTRCNFGMELYKAANAWNNHQNAYEKNTLEPKQAWLKVTAMALFKVGNSSLF